MSAGLTTANIITAAQTAGIGIPDTLVAAQKQARKIHREAGQQYTTVDHRTADVAKALRIEADSLPRKALSAFRRECPEIEQTAQQVFAELATARRQLDLPADVVDLESAAAHGGAIVDDWLESQRLDNKILATWKLLDELRLATLLEPTFVLVEGEYKALRERLEFSPAIKWLQRGGGSGGWLIRDAHRYSQLSDLTGTGCYTPAEARGHLEAYEAEFKKVVAEKKPHKRPAIWGG
jgi:hypothetical protein